MRNCNCNGNNNSCGNGCGNSNGCGRRRRRCGCMKLARSCWENFPYYTGPCPNADGCYGWQPYCYGFDDNCNDGCNPHCGQPCPQPYGQPFGQSCGNQNCGCGGNGFPPRPPFQQNQPCCSIFSAFMPVAISANGIIPLVFNNPCWNNSFQVNSGLVTVKEAGTYLGTYTVRVPENTALDTTVTLNVNEASQSSAITNVVTEAGAITSAYTGQAIFQANEGDTVSLRTSDAINVTESAAQPMFTLSLVKLDN